MLRHLTRLTAVCLFLAPAGLAGAATVINGDADPVVVVIVENGSRMEVALDPGAEETVCPSGCFLTLPNGDRIGLVGGETVEIRNGGAEVR